MEEHPREAGFITPKFIKEPTKKTLVFLGLNPSFPKGGKWQDQEKWNKLKQRIIRLKLLPSGFDDKKGDYRQAFLWKKIEKISDKKQKKVIKLFADIHHDARWYYPKWFKRLNCFAKKLGVERKDYGHIDCFLWSDAKSKSVETRVIILAGEKIVKAQEDFTKRLLAAHKPRMIVCVYMSAWKHFCKLYSVCPYKIKEYKLTGKKGDAVLKYADVKIDDVENSVIVIGCPDLPRGYGKYSIRKEHLEELFDFANKRYNR